MPLVLYYRGQRILKAKRAKAMRGRPRWQDQVPDTKAGRDTYAIAAKYEQTFAKAFLEATRNQITPEIEREFHEAWRTGSPAAVVNAIPFFTERADANVWKRFTDQLGVAYATVIQAAGDAATEDLNRRFRTSLQFYALPPPSDTEEMTGEVAEGLIQKLDHPFEHVGLFIRLPDEIARQFPAEGRGGSDESPPHITLLYYGDADEDDVERLSEVVRPALADAQPLRLRLAPVAEFKNADGQTIRHSPVVGSGLHALFDRLTKAIADAGIDWKRTYSRFRPHVTLEYVDPGKRPRIAGEPRGEWIADSCELWGGGKLIQYRFGGKSILKSMADVRAAARGMTVNVNPYSIKWIEQHGLDLVTQGISPQQKQLVTNIIERTMAVGGRPTNAIETIKANIGLTNREYVATLNRYERHIESGYSAAEAQALTAKYRDELLTKRAQRIARTETISAQAQGRKDAWLVAQDGGKLPEVKRRWISAPPSPDPKRPCEICLDLDGKEAKLNEPYQSLIGPIDGPTAHPSCRCSETLERA